VPPTLPQQQLTKAVQKWEELLARINPDVVLEEVQRAGAEVIIPQSPQWLEALQSLGDSTPLILYARGNVAGLPSACQKAVALVGARACSSYGRQVAVELAADLGGMGFCIISGGAVGIDASAHTGALGHSNIAFLPTGIDACYPRTNEPLFDKMLANGGTLLTEYPPNTSVAGFRFLERNRLIAGLAGGTVVVEASWRSGAISTANHTMEIGKPLGAVPGSVNSSTSAGCHKLIREYGATLITEAEDVREMLNNEVDLMSMVAREEAKNKKYARKFDDLPKLQRDIMHELERHNSCSTAKISDNLAIPQPEIVVEITKLQLLGLVEPSKRAGQYKRRKVQQRK
jgi:DNA processing protein